MSKSHIWLWYPSHLTARDSGVHGVETNSEARLLKFFLFKCWSFKYLFIYLLICTCVQTCASKCMCICACMYVKFRGRLAGDSSIQGLRDQTQVLRLGGNHLTYWAICSLILFKNIFFFWSYPLKLHCISQVMWKGKSQHPLIQISLCLCWTIIRDTEEKLTFTNSAPRCLLGDALPGHGQASRAMIEMKLKE